MEAVRILDAQFHRSPFRVGRSDAWRGCGRATRRWNSKLLLLLTERAFGLRTDIGKRGADADLRGGGNRSFDQRGRAKCHAGTHRFIEQVERQFGAQERAAQVQ